MHILVATDADWVIDEVRAALGEPGTTFTRCANGRTVSDAVAARTPDLVIADSQSGSMGGMAVTMQLRLDESSGRLPRVPVLILLDRIADIHLARRAAADGWLIKPLDALRLRRAARAVSGGETYYEGVPPVPGEPPLVELGAIDLDSAVEDAGSESVASG